MGRDTVLLFEPNISLRSTMEVMLRRNGHEVFAVGDEETALRVGRAKSPKLALLSCEPSSRNKDSFALCHSLVQQRVVEASVMGALGATQETVMRAIRAGALEFLVKPTNENVLGQKLDLAFARASKDTVSKPGVQQIDFGTSAQRVAERVDIIIQKAAAVRAMPQAVARVLQITEESKHGTNELSNAVSSDPSIAATVLKRAQSAHHAAANPAKGLAQAVIRLGFRQTRQLVLGLSVVNLVPQNGRSFGLNRRGYWLHSLACGVLAKLICQQARIEGGGDAFVAGLLHDIGKVMLDDFLSEDYQLVIQKANVERKSVYGTEVEALQRNHAMVGSAVASKWGFPEHIVEAIAEHHNSRRFDDGAAPPVNLTGAVYLANQMTKSLLVGSGGDFVVQEISASVWKAYGFGDVVNEAFLGRFYSEVADYCSFLEVQPSEFGLEMDVSKSKTAMVMARQGCSTVLSSLVLSSLNYTVERPSNIAGILKENKTPPFCLLHANSLQEAQNANKFFESKEMRCPMVWLIRHGISKEGIVDNGKPWIRAVPLPLDSFELSSAIRSAESNRP